MPLETEQGLSQSQQLTGPVKEFSSGRRDLFVASRGCAVNNSGSQPRSVEAVICGGTKETHGGTPMTPYDAWLSPYFFTRPPKSRPPFPASRAAWVSLPPHLS